ncbi:competence protein ComC [Prochlorococcus sp. AH-716-D22]|nr:competence protein ComC [Prochlorococcus sp. AH-716-D22]
MKITEALKSLEKSWSREEILVKIKNGEDSEKIVNDFCSSKQQEIETLTNFINPDDKVLLSEIEDLSNIESKLINKIKNYSFNKVDSSKKEIVQKQIPQSEKKISFDLGLFMMKWSNKFVFISLLAISAIALTKQAWA